MAHAGLRDDCARSCYAVDHESEPRVSRNRFGQDITGRFSEDTPCESNDRETETPCSEWPTQGSLRFENWSAHYVGLPVLYCVNMSISPGEKVAICGREGSGKSSLISPVLGMINGSSGKIVMDGVDVSTVPKEVVRQKVTCLTQESFLFDGSVRFNIDPLGEVIDGEIIAALEKVGLWTVIRQGAIDNGLPEGQALDLVVEEDKLFSSGQRQLFSLARAMLRKRPLLLLDEPKSSVDATTESSIQELIESEFSDTSVIMATHRLSGILDFHKVAVLDGGVLVEYGPPRDLLADSSTTFSKLYSSQQGGSGQEPR